MEYITCKDNRTVVEEVEHITYKDSKREMENIPYKDSRTAGVYENIQGQHARCVVYKNMQG